MIVDSSAVVAILLGEPDAERLLERLLQADVSGIGAPTAVETSIVVTHRIGPDGKALVERFLRECAVEVVPFGEAHWAEAVRAYERFGRGRHPAALNFGDCLSYAIAKLARQPLLCVGEDFPRTDLPLA